MSKLVCEECNYIYRKMFGLPPVNESSIKKIEPNIIGNVGD